MRADHRVVLHVAAQRDAARRAAVAHAGGDQTPAARRRWPARSQRARTSWIALAHLQARADDAAAPSSQRRRRSAAGANMRAPAATAARAQDVVELLARQHGQRAGHVDAAAARRRRRRHGWPAAPAPSPASSTPRRSARRGRRGSARRRRPCRAGRRAGRRARTSAPACASVARAGAAGRAGADHEHVAARRQAGAEVVGSVTVHEGRGSA